MWFRMGDILFWNFLKISDPLYLTSSQNSVGLVTTGTLVSFIYSKNVNNNMHREFLPNIIVIIIR